MKIQDLRTNAGMTQQELAARIEVTQGAVSLWESGGARPLKKHLRRIAEVFGVSVDELLEDASK